MEFERELFESQTWVSVVVRLKANKYYQELLCSLSSYINLLNLLNLQGLRGRLLASGWFQTSSLWSRLLTNPNLKEGAFTCNRVCPIVWLVGRDLTLALSRSDTCFVAIRPLSDESLNLGRLVGRSRLVDRWFNWMMLSILFSQLFSWAVQDGIIPLNDHASTSDLH